MSFDQFDRMAQSAGPAGEDGPALPRDRLVEAAAFLKALGHEGRLAILCHLVAGERSVTALERLLGQRQAAVSQQLARLRLEGMVQTRRDGKTIYYSIQDPRVLQIVTLLHSFYCEDPA